jgi:hypothetical protein
MKNGVILLNDVRLVKNGTLLCFRYPNKINSYWVGRIVVAGGDINPR